MNNQPIFIIGNPRSGTTLLRLLLHKHQNITIPPEAGFALWLYENYKDYSQKRMNDFLVDMKKTKKIENWKIQWDELKLYLKHGGPKNYPELIMHVYNYYAKSIGKKSMRWGDKNNFYLNYIDDIKKLFPEALFIHIVRDGRNVACSYKELSQKQFTSEYAPSYSNRVDEIANVWNNNLNKSRSSFEKFGFKNVYELKFEDLIEEPKNKMREIFRFIGEDYEDGIFEFYKLSEDDGGEPREYLSEWKEKNLKPLQKEDKNKFRYKLTRDEILIFNTIAGVNLLHYGYEL